MKELTSLDSSTDVPIATSEERIHCWGKRKAGPQYESQTDVRTDELDQHILLKSRENTGMVNVTAADVV